jgi:hypothetical protein
MNSQQLKEINLAYQSVYNSQLTEGVESDNLEELDLISDRELSQILEEVIEGLLDEGYDIEEIEEAFEDDADGDFLSEARMTDKQKEMRSKFKAQQAAQSAQTTKETEARKKSAARKERVEKVKASMRSGVAKVKAKVQSGKEKVASGVETAKKKVHEPLVSYAGKRDLYTSKAGKPLKGSAKTAKMASTTRGSERRAELRSKVAQDVKSRVAAKVERAKGKASAAMTSAKEAPGKAKRSLKKAARGALLGLARRLKEEGGELDAFDAVVAYLLDEGFASDFDHAQALMVNLDSDTIHEVYEHQLSVLNEAI